MIRMKRNKHLCNLWHVIQDLSLCLYLIFPQQCTKKLLKSACKSNPKRQMVMNGCGWSVYTFPDRILTVFLSPLSSSLLLRLEFIIPLWPFLPWIPVVTPAPPFVFHHPRCRVHRSSLWLFNGPNFFSFFPAALSVFHVEARSDRASKVRNHENRLLRCHHVRSWLVSRYVSTLDTWDAPLPQDKFLS